MFYEQESVVVLPVNPPASNKVILSAVTLKALYLNVNKSESAIGTGTPESANLTLRYRRVKLSSSSHLNDGGNCLSEIEAAVVLRGDCYGFYG